MPVYRVTKSFINLGTGVNPGDTVQVSIDRARKLGRMGYISTKEVVKSLKKGPIVETAIVEPEVEDTKNTSLQSKK